MLWIIVGIVVGFAALWAESILANKEETDENFLRKVFSVNKYAWGMAIALGVIFALPGMIKISLWMLILQLVAMAVIAVWWHGFRIGENEWLGGGDEPGELFMFMILDGIFFCSALILAGIVKVSLFWPMAVGLVSAGAMIIRLLQKKAQYGDASPYWWKVVAAIMVALLIATGFKMIPDWNIGWLGAKAEAEDVADEEAMAEDELGLEDEELPEEAEDILVEWTKKESNRIDSEFAKKLKEQAGDDEEITPEVVKEVILQDCKDPKVLAIWGYKFGLHEDPDDYKSLMEKSDGKERLSENGVRLYNKVEGYLGAVTAKREKAPEDGLNTGYDGGFVTSETYGIEGDRTGTRMTCPNGEVFWVMDRCANIVYRGGSTPNLPTGKTDNPSKPKGKGSPPKYVPQNSSGPKYNKDPKKAKGKNQEKNDDRGTGKKTIDPTGKDPNHSTEEASKKGGSSSTTAKSPTSYNEGNSEANKGSGGGNAGGSGQQTGSKEASPTTGSGGRTVDNKNDGGHTEKSGGSKSEDKTDGELSEPS